MQLLFRNKLAALIWAALSLVGAAGFVSSGGGLDRAKQAYAGIEQQHRAVTATPPLHQLVAENPDPEPVVPLGYTEDTDRPGSFIGPDGRRYRMVVRGKADEAMGSDPTPTR